MVYVCHDSLFLKPIKSKLQDFRRLHNPVLTNEYLEFYFSGPSDPLPSILVWRDQVISANMNGRIGVYNLQEETSEVR